MGDRSYGSFIIPKEYAEFAAREVFADGWEGRDEDPAATGFWDFEVSGGGYDQAEQLRDLEVPYHWTWCECPGVYEAGQEVFVPEMGSVGAAPDGPVAQVDKYGNADSDDVELAVKYHRIDEALNVAIR